MFGLTDSDECGENIEHDSMVKYTQSIHSFVSKLLAIASVLTLK